MACFKKQCCKNFCNGSLAYLVSLLKWYSVSSVEWVLGFQLPQLQPICLPLGLNKYMSHMGVFKLSDRHPVSCRYDSEKIKCNNPTFLVPGKKPRHYWEAEKGSKSFRASRSITWQLRTLLDGQNMKRPWIRLQNMLFSSSYSINVLGFIKEV